MNGTSNHNSAALTSMAKDLDLLLVEDEVMLLEIFQKIFKRFFRSVETATNGQEGLERLREKNYDLVITDIQMPSMNGLDMIEKIRESDPDQGVMILSAHNDKEYYQRAIELNVDGYLNKPMQEDETMHVLCRTLEKLIGRQTLKSLQVKADENAQHYLSLLKQYKDAVDTSTIVSKANRNGVITYVNEAFCTISQYTQEELIGHSHNLVRHPDMPENFFKELWQTLLNKKTFNGIIKNRAKDGSEYYVNTHIVPILDDGGEIEEFFSIRQDITEQMHAAIKEKELSEMKDQFLRNISHGVRTPLSNIIGLSPFLKQCVKDEKSLRYIDIIYQSAHQVDDMVQRILLLSQLEGGVYISTLSSALPEAVLHRLEETYSSKAQEKSHSMQWHLESCTQQSVTIDWEAFRIIAGNLLDNAIIFTPEHGCIEVRAMCKENTFTFRVSDNGSGIPEEKLSRIYDPFVQADSSNTRLYHGLGIGLTLAKKLTELLGGTLSCTTTSEGTTFLLDVPTKR